MPTSASPMDVLGASREALQRLRQLGRRERHEAFRQLINYERALLRRTAGAHQVTLTVHFEDAGDGWVLATIPEVPGAISQGRDRAEARENVIDALRTVLTPDDRLSGAAADPGDEPLTLMLA